MKRLSVTIIVSVVVLIVGAAFLALAWRRPSSPVMPRVVPVAPSSCSSSGVGLTGAATLAGAAAVEFPPVRVPILVYHHVRPDLPKNLRPGDGIYFVKPAEFAAEMGYLKDNGFHPVTFAALVNYFRSGAALPPHPVIISLDDGLASQWQYAFPILQADGLTATFFIFTNAPGRNPDYLTWEQIKRMDEAGNAIASHTRLHPYLTKATDANLVSELVGSRQDLEKHLGHPVSVLAYPFGLADSRVWAATAQAGYVAARALHHRVVISATDLLDLPGYIMTGNLSYFKRVVTGEEENK